MEAIKNVLWYGVFVCVLCAGVARGDGSIEFRTEHMKIAVGQDGHISGLVSRSSVAAITKR